MSAPREDAPGSEGLSPCGRSDSALFDAALEFGESWRRDIAALAAERLPTMSQAERAALAEEIDHARTSIEQWILIRWEDAPRGWSNADAGVASAFIRSACPWMAERNVAKHRQAGHRLPLARLSHSHPTHVVPLR